MSTKSEPERFFSMDATRYKGECGYSAEWPNAADATNAELMWLVVVSEAMAAQFREEVIERVGEERAYYLEEYQKASLKDFTARVSVALARQVQEAAARDQKELEDALTLIRKHNPQFKTPENEQDDDHNQA